MLALQSDSIEKLLKKSKMDVLQKTNMLLSQSKNLLAQSASSLQVHLLLLAIQGQKVMYLPRKIGAEIILKVTEVLGQKTISLKTETLLMLWPKLIQKR